MAQAYVDGDKMVWGLEGNRSIDHVKRKARGRSCKHSVAHVLHTVFLIHRLRVIRPHIHPAHSATHLSARTNG